MIGFYLLLFSLFFFFNSSLPPPPQPPPHPFTLPNIQFFINPSTAPLSSTPLNCSLSQPCTIYSAFEKMSKMSKVDPTIHFKLMFLAGSYNLKNMIHINDIKSFEMIGYEGMEKTYVKNDIDIDEEKGEEWDEGYMFGMEGDDMEMMMRDMTIKDSERVIKNNGERNVIEMEKMKIMFGGSEEEEEEGEEKEKKFIKGKEKNWNFIMGNKGLKKFWMKGVDVLMGKKYVIENILFNFTSSDNLDMFLVDVNVNVNVIREGKNNNNDDDDDNDELGLFSMKGIKNLKVYVKNFNVSNWNNNIFFIETRTGNVNLEIVDSHFKSINTKREMIKVISDLITKQHQEEGKFNVLLQNNMFEECKSDLSSMIMISTENFLMFNSIENNYYHCGSKDSSIIEIISLNSLSLFDDDDDECRTFVNFERDVFLGYKPRPSRGGRIQLSLVNSLVNFRGSEFLYLHDIPIFVKKMETLKLFIDKCTFSDIDEGVIHLYTCENTTNVEFVISESHFSTNNVVLQQLGGMIYVHKDDNMAVTTKVNVSIAGTSFNGNSAYRGGVFSCYNPGSGMINNDANSSYWLSLTVESCLFRENVAFLTGGVFHISETKLLLINNKFISNHVLGSQNPRGGVVKSLNSYILSRSNYYEGNTAENGGVFFSSNSNLVIDKDEFLSNQATVGGGTVYLSKDIGYFELTKNSRIIDSSAQFGGAIFVNVIRNKISNIYINGIVESNRATVGGGGVFFSNMNIGSKQLINVKNNVAKTSCGDNYLSSPRKMNVDVGPSSLKKPNCSRIGSLNRFRCFIPSSIVHFYDSYQQLIFAQAYKNVILKVYLNSTEIKLRTKNIHKDIMFEIDTKALADKENGYIQFRKHQHDLIFEVKNPKPVPPTRPSMKWLVYVIVSIVIILLLITCVIFFVILYYCYKGYDEYQKNKEYEEPIFSEKIEFLSDEISFGL